MRTRTVLFSGLLVLSSFRLIAQTEVQGTILDAVSADPLVGATVFIEGTTRGTTTDAEGSFSLTGNGEYPVTLVISYLGYETQLLGVSDARAVDLRLTPSSAALNEVVVTARRRNEEAQEIPIPIAVLGERELSNSVSFNVNMIKELVPSVQLYSSNPRNTTLNIRGLGSTFGLTNDGIDPGVGFYVDGVYFARPAATTLDFIDVQQIEVLRGPQGTLFGKNTTAGTFNVTSKKPTFTPTGTLEQSFGNFGFIQTKGSISGPIVENKVAARFSFTGTHRDGTLYNVRTDAYTNTLSNQGVKGQLVYLPTGATSIRLIADYSRQRPDGYAQVYAGTVPTQSAAFRQFDRIISDLDYQLPTTNPFDRIIDHNTPWQSNQDMGGVSVQGDLQLGKGMVSSTTAWRNWKWDPSNDRDFTGLSGIARSQAPSIHHQWSQEVRYAGELSPKLGAVVGLFAFYQTLDPDGAHVLEAGPDQWRFVQNTEDTLWRTPGLLDGLTEETRPRYSNFSGAVFGQLNWKLGPRLTILPGLRLNYDEKKIDFQRTVTGGLQTEDPKLLSLQARVFTPISFATAVDNWNVSGQLSFNYLLGENLRTYATYSLAFKPVGLNLGGIPSENGQPLLDLAVVKPERVNHLEVGIKSEPLQQTTLNLTAYYTDIRDYQTNVRSADLGVSRGYLANAESVRVAGAELEAAYFHARHLKWNASVSYTDGIYRSFKNAPVPLEDTGGAEYKDISGERLPGISNWTASGGLELFTKGKFLHQEGEVFLGSDLYCRSGFSSSPSASRYLNIAGYALLNARVGFRRRTGTTLFIWGRNIANTNYFEQLLPAAGNSGYYAAVLGDPGTVGLTLRYSFQ